MPESNTYTVTQTREVEVSAFSPEAAVVAASERWDNPDVPGAAYRVRVVSVNAVRRERAGGTR